MSYRAFYTKRGVPYAISRDSLDQIVQAAAELVLGECSIHSMEDDAGHPIQRDWVDQRVEELEASEWRARESPITHELVIRGPDTNWYVAGQFTSEDEANHEYWKISHDISVDRLRVREAGQP